MSDQPRSTALSDDKIENVSDTSLWVAVYRALESERPDALFHDPLAKKLSGERGKRIAKAMTHSQVMAWIMAIRTVTIDRLIEASIANGVDTVVNLGAGLDTRPYRMNLQPELRWVEVDFPNIIDHKNSTLASEHPACRLERIAIDLSDKEQARALFKRVNSEARKVLVITEGVIPYLTPEHAAQLAGNLLECERFQYWIQDFFDIAFVSRSNTSWRKKLQHAPFKFAVNDWLGFFVERGWKVKNQIYMIDESLRLGRRPPFIFPWSLIGFITEGET
jgi:methyltransferase (TIGR00027 family)